MTRIPNNKAYLRTASLQVSGIVSREFRTYLRTELNDECPCWLLITERPLNRDSTYVTNSGEDGGARGSQGKSLQNTFLRDIKAGEIPGRHPFARAEP
jgi:hypothetical protein